MADDIPFNKKYDFAPETVDEPAPGIRRILCDNPGPFTFTGTNSYIIGRGKVAIIDPGPANDTHIATARRPNAGGPREETVAASAT